MKEQWFLTTKKADFAGIGAKFHIDPVIARIIRNRDIIEEAEIDAYLHGRLEDLADSMRLKGMAHAIDVFQSHRDEKIRIIGDYDIDGVCSTYILVRGLKELRCNVDSAIPHRVMDGYGLNDRLIEEAHADGVSLIITCDNGIAAYQQIVRAKELGMHVIVTDHHEVPFEEDETGKRYILPPADALIDPKQPGETYPFPGICGGFVAYHFIRALYAQLEYENATLMDEFTEIAAFATVGDVMELRGENRILVKEGLRRMRHTGNVGLKCLIRACGLLDKELTAYSLGFVLGPCLNATGRLDSAKRAFDLLMEKEESVAMEIAIDLKEMNDSRKDLTLKGVEEAEKQMEDWNLALRPIIVLYLSTVHESLAGIIAGRIREHYNHPTFILTDGEEGLKGSGRSVEGYHMFEELVKVKTYLTKFGGHTLAAGLSLDKENLDAFVDAINRNCTCDAQVFVRKVSIDVNMPLSYASIPLVEQMSVLEPFGNGNGKPVFAQSNLLFHTATLVGTNNRVMRFVVSDDTGRRHELTCFTAHEIFDAYVEEKYSKEALEQLYRGIESGIRLSVLYYPGINEYKGKRSLQLVMQGYK